MASSNPQLATYVLGLVVLGLGVVTYRAELRVASLEEQVAALREGPRTPPRQPRRVVPKKRTDRRVDHTQPTPVISEPRERWRRLGSREAYDDGESLIDEVHAAVRPITRRLSQQWKLSPSQSDDLRDIFARAARAMGDDGREFYAEAFERDELRRRFWAKVRNVDLQIAKQLSQDIAKKWMDWRQQSYAENSLLVAIMGPEP